METYFNIRYEFERDEVHRAIETRLNSPGSDYVCVADGVILDTANRHPEYLEVVNSGMFAICDSSFVPLYIKWLYGRQREQYCGADIFRDIVSSRRYRMIFLGSQQHVLDALRANITKWNPDVETMIFRELPFLSVEEFDYAAIGRMVEEDGADIVWVSLGAPKQEYFMHHLKPYLHRGVMIAVGAAFKYFSGLKERRAPDWMVRAHMEFLFRITQSPRKQLRRCRDILASLPRLLLDEKRRMVHYTTPPQLTARQIIKNAHTGGLSLV